MKRGSPYLIWFPLPAAAQRGEGGGVEARGEGDGGSAVARVAGGRGGAKARGAGGDHLP